MDWTKEQRNMLFTALPSCPSCLCGTGQYESVSVPTGTAATELGMKEKKKEFYIVEMVTLLVFLPLLFFLPLLISPATVVPTTFEIC